MNHDFKPNGYNSLSPYLVVDGAQRMIDLLEKIFNAKELRRYDLTDGKIMHAEIQIDDSVLMIGDASEHFTSAGQLLHVYVPDVDEVFDAAVKAGCTSMEVPNNKEGDPDRRGTFEDFAGNIWSVATQL
ncbi:MAG: VOC family protein [Alkalicoccus sp.]|nr:MAG: VOC family protein [Alkalicoccus sp.]